MSSVTRAPISATTPKLSWPSVRNGLPSGASPYSPALISLSVPSTPTRSTLTRTPRPFGMSSTFGLGSAARWTLSGLWGMTATAFIGSSSSFVSIPIGRPRFAGVGSILRAGRLDEQERVPVGVPRQKPPPKSQVAAFPADAAPGDQAAPGPAPGRGGRRGAPGEKTGLPRGEIVGPLVRRRLAPVGRGEVFQEFDPGACGSPQAGDPQARAEYVVQVLLFRPVVLALSRDPHPEGVPV